MAGRCCTRLFPTLAYGQGGGGVFRKYFKEKAKKKKKAAIFCLNIPLTKSIDHSWVSWEGERWRGMFYSLITPTFTPSCLSIVVLLLVTLAHRSSESGWDWSYFMLGLPGPQFEKSSVSVFTRGCHLPHFCLYLYSACRPCGALCSVINGSKKCDTLMFSY